MRRADRDQLTRRYRQMLGHETKARSLNEALQQLPMRTKVGDD